MTQSKITQTKPLNIHFHIHSFAGSGGSGFLGITQLTFGIFGSAVSLVSMVIVSLMTQEPDKATQKMVDNVRVPSGKTILGKQH